MLKISLYPLQYISGSVCDCNGKILIQMNRQTGTTPLLPVERDEMAEVVCNLLNAELEKLIFKFSKGQQVNWSYGKYTHYKIDSFYKDNGINFYVIINPNGVKSLRVPESELQMSGKTTG